LSTDAADAAPVRSTRSLDLSNFFLADVRHNVGPRCRVLEHPAGCIFVVAGYHVAFISLGSIAPAGLVLYATAMSETGPGAT
jgi:hypothetical protein